MFLLFLLATPIARIFNPCPQSNKQKITSKQIQFYLFLKSIVKANSNVLARIVNPR
jgi:multisubunit Na+/H+ antiporter MnhE subunit